MFYCFRGFGFITFGDPASVDKVLAQGTHELDGKKVSSFSKRAIFLITIRIYEYVIRSTDTTQYLGDKKCCYFSQRNSLLYAFKFPSVNLSK